MKKLMLILVALLFSANFAFADCNPPEGLTVNPPWEEGAQPVSVIYFTGNICNGWTYCEVKIYWCYRMIDGKCQICIGDIEFTDLCYSSPEKYQLCLDYFDNKEELILDYAINVIATNYTPCVPIVEIPDCGDATAPDAYAVYVYQVSCETEPQILWDPETNKNRLVKKPCNSESYCEYKYSYCWETDDNGDLVAIYSKELIMSNQVQCEPLLISNNWVSCYPKDCHQDRISIKRPTDADIIQVATAPEYYQNNQFVQY